MSALVLGRYGEADFLAMFGEAGVLEKIEKRGFRELAFELDGSREPLTHIRLLGTKDGARLLLLDACLTEVRLEAGTVAAAGVAVELPLDLVVVYWLREQDPTANFDAEHHRLPLQEHPGLGVLRSAFHVAVRVARELGKHGIAALPKFFHDAAIFYRSRLFLFLDPCEQGRFEALLRDLAGLSLEDASMALAGSAVRDAGGNVVHWQPGFQVMPLTAELTDCFHSEAYQQACVCSFETCRFSVDADALAVAREVYERSLSLETDFSPPPRSTS
jgi:hypothetical protein